MTRLVLGLALALLSALALPACSPADLAKAGALTCLAARAACAICGDKDEEVRRAGETPPPVVP